MTDRSPHPHTSFIADVERLRKKRGLSVQELATRSDLSLDEVECILRGEGRLQLDAVILLARGLGVPPGRLIDGIAEISDDG